MGLTEHPISRNKLLTHVLDDIARDTPSKLFAEIPRSTTTFADGFRDVTYRDLANAVNGFAAFLENALGKGTSNETLPYVGIQDLRYVILILGAVKAGYNLLLFSPRSPPPAAANLFNKTSAKTILVPNPRPSFLDSILEQHPLKEIEIPSLEMLLDTEYPLYPHDVSFEEVRHQPFVTAHTSGSTGLPKPVVITHDWVSSLAEEMYLTTPEGYESSTGEYFGSRAFSQMPFFHIGFVSTNIISCLLTGTMIVYPLAALPPSAETVADVLDYKKVDVASILSMNIERMTRDPVLRDRICSKVGRIYYAGAPISTETGDEVSRHVKLYNQFGLTELGMFYHVKRAGPVDESWRYLGFHPESNVHFVRRKGDIHEVFPDKQEYFLGDLFTPHPTEPGLWKYEGRNDDMIVFASAEKFWPLAAENLIKKHSDVNEAVIIGAGRSRVALLLEVGEKEGISSEEIVERVWPAIEATHNLCSPAAKIRRDFIIVVDPSRPLPRTAKSSIQRKDAAKLYEDDLARLDQEAARKNITAPATEMEILTDAVKY